LTCWSLHVISSQQVLSCSVFNNPPVASNQSVLVNINTATGLVLKGSDADGDPITFRTNSLPLHGTLSNFNTLTGAITYSPVTSFTGSDSFTFLVNDGATNSTPATVSITVLNNPPVASNQTVSVPANTATNLTLRGSDPDGSPISFRTNSLPANGTLSNFNTLTGAITYTPGTSFVGADSFTFLVNDGLTNSAPGTVSITVVSVDSVGDGIPDWWRAQYFGGNGTTTNSQSCALCDPDGDGMGNLSEYLSGTVPTNSASVFRIISITHENESVRVTWTTVGQKTYQVQISTEPAGGYSPNFVDLGSPVIVPGVGESMTNYVDVGASTNAPGRYYRLRLVP